MLSQLELKEALNPARVGMEVKINEVPYFPVGTDISVDVEHNELGDFVCCGFGSSSGSCYVLFDIELVKQFKWDSYFLVGHNIKTDLTLLRQWGVEINSAIPLHDTHLYAHILDSSYHEYGLKYLARELLSIEYPSYDDIVGRKTKKQVVERITLDAQPQEIVAHYNAWDCYATFKLYEYQQQRLRMPERDYFTKIERPVSIILETMEARGIRVNLPYLKDLQAQLEAKLKPLKEAVLNQLGPINLESPKQLLAALKTKGVTPIWRGKQSTDRRALENVRTHPIISTLLSYREIETLLSSFVLPYLTRNAEFVHPFFNQCGTRTGRLSCSNPNLLQIPRRTDNGKLVRSMFTARLGMYLGDCDFGQIEPRVLAHLSADQGLLQLFNDGIDFHEFTASHLGINRERAKVLNLSVGYRATWKAVKQQLKCSQQEAQNEIDRWWSLFPRLRRWQDQLLFSARRSGYCETLLGRRIKVEKLDSENVFQREAAERQCINNITQGSAAEIMKLAMINVDTHKHLLNKGFGILVQVYDELLFESPDIDNDFGVVKNLMESAVELSVPIVVDGAVGVNWAECH